MYPDVARLSLHSISCLILPMYERLQKWRGTLTGWSSTIQWPGGGMPQWDVGLSLFQPVE